jgi:Recombinase
MKKISACPSWLGLSDDRTSFVFLPERAEIVQKIFELSIGGLGGYTIANYLNRQNIPVFGPSPKWDQSTIDYMLRNRATVGEHQPKSYAGGSKKGVAVGAPIPNYYPAVVDEATFQAAQKARQQNLMTGRGSKGRHITNIFTGLTTCAYCASPVKFYSNGNAKSLMCSKVLSGTGCIRSAWSYRNFERSVLHFLAHPALTETLESPKQEMIATLVGHIRHLSGPDVYNARFEITSILKKILSELKLACAGPEPAPTLPDALIRRDKPGRFFEVKLWDGRLYVGLPIEE